MEGVPGPPPRPGHRANGRGRSERMRQVRLALRAAATRARRPARRGTCRRRRCRAPARTLDAHRVFALGLLDGDVAGHVGGVAQTVVAVAVGPGAQVPESVRSRRRARSSRWRPPMMTRRVAALAGRQHAVGQQAAPARRRPRRPCGSR